MASSPLANRWEQIAGIQAIGHVGAVGLEFYTNDTSRMRITSGGKVGIGTANLAAAGLLQVNAAVNRSTTNSGNAFLVDTTAMAAGVGGTLYFGGKYDAAGTSFAEYAYVAGVKSNATDGNFDGDLILGTRTNGASPNTERMRILANGNVGIGTTSPGAKLDVNGDVLTTSNLNVRYNDGGCTKATHSWANFTVNGSNDTIGLYQAAENSMGIQARRDCQDNPASLILQPQYGNVGIGTTSPQVVFQAGSATNRIGVEARTDGMSIGGVGAANSARLGGFYLNNPIPFAAIHFGAQGPNGRQGGIALLTKAVDDDTTQPSAKMVIDQTGNVGIGTASPQGTLHVAGTRIYLGSTAINTGGTNNIAIDSASGGSGWFIAGNANNRNLNMGYYSTDSASDPCNGDAAGAGTGCAVVGTYGNSDALYLSGSKVILGGGNVGIGTATPNARLEVKGQIKASGTSADGAAMYFAGGSFTFSQAQSQCTAGYHTCTAQEFIGYMAIYHDVAKSGYGWSSVRALAPCNSDGDGNCATNAGTCGAGQAMLLKKETNNGGTPYGSRGGAFCYADGALFNAYCCIN